MDVEVVGESPSLEGATLVAGIIEGLSPVPGSEEAFDRADRSLLEAAGFEGKAFQVLRLPHPEADALLLVGVGGSPGFTEIRAASGEAARAANTKRLVSLLPSAGISGSSRGVVEGSILGAYNFGTYKTEDDGTRVESLELVGGDAKEAEEARVTAMATNLARDWVNTPAMDKSPDTLAGLMATAATAAAVTVDIWDADRIREERLGGLLGVAAGSDREPRLVELSYKPEGATAHLALVGKGIIFDTGGLSIKTSKFMEEMKDDMSGAAIVVAATVGIARLGVPVRVTTIAPLTDNAISGKATRPGDVLRPVAGPTVEVLNTDAEGRLILADGLGLARQHDPDLIVDVATLTGAARAALGDEIAAVFGSDDETAGLLLDAAARAGEEMWQMPLYEGYRPSLDSPIADIKNISGSRYGGAIVAALFLAQYAGDGPWAHLDIAGPARARETKGEKVKGASGVAVRTLIELAREMAETG